LIARCSGTQVPHFAQFTSGPDEEVVAGGTCFSFACARIAFSDRQIWITPTI
jgi:hypothetical protein